MKKWSDVVKAIGSGFESSCYETPEFKSFAKAFKAFIKKELEQSGARLVSFTKGHFYCSGVYELNGQFAYFSIADVRSPRTQIMFRTMESVNAKSDKHGPNCGGLMNEDLTRQMLNVWR